VKGGSGTIHAQGAISATCFDLDRCMKTLPQPWATAMEATVSGGSTTSCNHMPPRLKVAYPLTLWAIAAPKKGDRREEDLRTPSPKRPCGLRATESLSRPQLKPRAFAALFIFDVVIY
jgi:hypothetical protein